MVKFLQKTFIIVMIRKGVQENGLDDVQNATGQVTIYVYVGFENIGFVESFHLSIGVNLRFNPFEFFL